MFEKILIANRGEIACRIIRTARALGIDTVAVYSDADSNARHVKMADEAWYLGPSPATESYLVTEKILQIAMRVDAQAIHPGYGFLSENADLARQCENRGIQFVGPSADAIESMGNKDAAKCIMEQAGVPVVPGYHGKNQDAEYLQRQANDTGYPLLIKAVAGGGGKGMRVVDSESGFQQALNAARREAEKSFSDDRVLLEKYIENPRHIEFQIFGDCHGNTVHLFERDCSIQRRYQKVVEEAPAPDFDEKTRSVMGLAATAAAAAIDYTGAGTVEFIVDSQGLFYFMEMNTRLQVEHPVTEETLGLDLVDWQLRVAAGEALPLSQDQIQQVGHALEVRIYAEDSDNNFLPSTGKIKSFVTPITGPNVRLDTGISAGDDVSPHYDPMIAKLIVRDGNRRLAIKRLQHALAQFHIEGIKTNISWLRSIVSHPDFVAGAVNTHFIDENSDSLGPVSGQINADICCLLAARLLQWHAPEYNSSDDPYSPWNDTAYWRLNNPPLLSFEFRANSRIFPLQIQRHGSQVAVQCDSIECKFILLNQNLHQCAIQLEQRRLQAEFHQHGDFLDILIGNQTVRVELIDRVAHADIEDTEPGSLNAPMPGKIIQLFIDQGVHVKKGDPLLVLEAMKMEHTIVAPFDGRVDRLFFQTGDAIEEGQQLVHIEAG